VLSSIFFPCKDQALLIKRYALFLFYYTSQRTLEIQNIMKRGTDYPMVISLFPISKAFFSLCCDIIVLLQAELKTKDIIQNCGFDEIDQNLQWNDSDLN